MSNRRPPTARHPAGFAEVCDELDDRRHVTLGLERVETLLSLLGDPQKALRIVQVVGTNGKGTTTVALAAALGAAGLPSGAYLSPHVLSYTERVMVGGAFVSEERFADAMWGAIEAADANGVEASQFELLTAGAIKLFADEGLSWAVLEAGLGARHDATTAARPEAVVLTNVGLDHSEYLGDTVVEISREKLASVAPGAVLILGTDDPDVVTEAGVRCEEVGARLVEFAGHPEIPVPGGMPPYAVDDVRLGIRAAEILLERTSSGEERARVVGEVVGALPGRFEMYEVREVPVVVDGGHNVPGLEAALEAVRAAYGARPLAVVLGVLRDKDVGSMLTALRREADAIVLTRPEGGRAAEPVGIEREHGPLDRGGRRALVAEDAVEAVNAAVEEVRGAGGVVLVAGSLSTAAPVLRWLRGR